MWRHKWVVAMRVAVLLGLLASAAVAETPLALSPDAPAIPSANAKQAKPNAHTFTLSAPVEAPQRVNVAGDFNGWSRDSHPMQLVGGVWTATIEMSEGLHHYKFVLNGDKWINDPAADKDLEEDDGHGGKNSGVIIGPDARKLPPAQPNTINGDGIIFDPRNPADLNVFAEGRARVRIRVLSDDVQSIAAATEVGGTKLARLTTERGFDVYGGVFDFDPGNPRFMFAIADGDTAGWFDVTGFHSAEAGPDRPEKFVMFELSAKPSFTTPDWAKHAVWYQIFAERFRNGDPANDPGDRKFEHLVRWQADWWKAQPGEAKGDQNFYKGEGNVWKRRYGGDIQGVKEKLPYLRSLGVTAIYFNPIFEADSMHKYDTSDYRHVDQHFGVRETLPLAGETDDPATWKWSESDKVFLDFLDEAHKQGFKVVVDGVFNHVGRSHPFFQDVVKNGKASRYADWFEIESWPDKLPADEKMFGKAGGLNFKAWDGPSGHLPVFRKDGQLGLARGPRDHIFAITKRWLAPDGDPSKGIDGWRLDVPGDIPHPFWIDWRKVVKETKPDAYISGEIWGWAQPWLNGGDQFDAVMNYQFAMAAQDFFVNRGRAISPSQMNNRCVAMEYNYPFQVSLVQMNLFDSHDTDRLASMFVNPDRSYDQQNRPQDNAAQSGYDARKPNEQEWTRMRQAVTFQMSFLGAPMIYYGNEAGMWSPDDPSNRQPMIWKDLEPYDDREVTFDAKQFEHHQRTIAIRAALPALQTGFYRPVLLDDAEGVFAFARELDGQTVYVVINRIEVDSEIDLPLAAGENSPLFNWLDMNSTELNASVDAKADARPTIGIKPDALEYEPVDGRLRLHLPPFGSMILAPKPKQAD